MAPIIVTGFDINGDPFIKADVYHEHYLDDPLEDEGEGRVAIGTAGSESGSSEGASSEEISSEGGSSEGESSGEGSSSDGSSEGGSSEGGSSEEMSSEGGSSEGVSSEGESSGEGSSSDGSSEGGSSEGESSGGGTSQGGSSQGGSSEGGSSQTGSSETGSSEEGSSEGGSSEDACSFSDPFTYSDGELQTVSGGKWAVWNSWSARSLNVVSGQLHVDGTETDIYGIYQTPFCSANHYSKFYWVGSTQGSNAVYRLFCRSTSSSDVLNAYIASGGTAATLWRRVGASWSNIGGGTVTYEPGWVTISADATTITVSGDAGTFDVTDSILSSGLYGGVGFFVNGGGWSIDGDAWSGGNAP